jgi:hypothetical protein
MHRVSLSLILLAMAGAAQDLEWMNEQPIILDADGAGAITMVLRNKSADDIVDLGLVVDQFTHTVNGATYTLKSTATVTPAPGGKSVAKNNGTVPVAVSVSNVTAAGESTAKVRYKGQVIATLRAIRVPAAYNVQIVSPTPDNPEIHLVGDRARFTLKNGDALTYPFQWQLRYNGELYQGEPFTLPAAGTYDLTLPIQATDKTKGPSSAWFWSGTLKDETGKGSLILTPQFAGVEEPLAAKEIPVGLRFSFWGVNGQEIWNWAVTFLLLAVGGVASILINAGIPNTRSALALRRQIGALDAKVAGLDPSIDSQWRALLEARLTKLREPLKSGKWRWILPSSAATLKSATDEYTMIQQWVEIVYNTSVLTHDMAEGAATIPPTVRAHISESCRKALSPMESGFTSNDELTAMKASLADAQQLLDTTLAGAGNPDLEKEIKAREGELTTQDRTGLADRHAEIFGPLIRRANDMAEKNVIPPDTYVDRDIVSLKMEWLRAYDDLLLRRPTAVAAAANANLAAAVQSAGTRLQAHGPRLVEYMIPDTFDSLRIATLLVTEMREDLYADGALTDGLGELRIEHEPAEVKANEPLRLQLRFDRQLLNEAAARQEWTVRWNFDDGSKEETGWEVWHVFPTAGKKTATVTMVDLKGNAIQPAPPNKIIDVQQPERPNWGPENTLEVVRTGVVLLIALLGLMTAAQQKVEDLTFFEAVGAVIALGFGADTIKNLVLKASSD